MVRVKSGMVSKRKHNKILGLAKGYWMTRHKQFGKAQEAVLHAGEYAFKGRKLRKRDFRALWIIRINAALREMGLTYSKFINQLKLKKVEVDRKILSELATNYPLVFKKVVEKVK